MTFLIFTAILVSEPHFAGRCPRGQVNLRSAYRSRWRTAPTARAASKLRDDGQNQRNADRDADSNSHPLVETPALLPLLPPRRLPLLLCTEEFSHSRFVFVFFALALRPLPPVRPLRTRTGRLSHGRFPFSLAPVECTWPGHVVRDHSSKVGAYILLSAHLRLLYFLGSPLVIWNHVQGDYRQVLRIQVTPTPIPAHGTLR